MTAPIHLSAEATSVPLRGLLAAEEAPAGRRPEALGAGGPSHVAWAVLLRARGAGRAAASAPLGVGAARWPAADLLAQPKGSCGTLPDPPGRRASRQIHASPDSPCTQGLESLGGQRRRPRPRWRTQRLPLQWLQPPEPSGHSAAGLPAPVGTSHPPHSGPLQSQGPASRKPGHRHEDGHPRRAWGRAPGPRHRWSVTSSQTPRRPPWSQQRLMPTVPSRGGGSGRPSAPASLVQTAEFQRRSASLKF